MASISTSYDQLQILFFPHLSYGHLIPTVDMARLFARNGVKVTIATTPFNASLFAAMIQRERESGSEISTCTIEFPWGEASLPQGCENMSCITSEEMSSNFFKALNLLQTPLEKLVDQRRPHCLVADVMYPWATDVAGKFGIPRLVFHGTSCFALSVFESLIRHQPYMNVASDSEPFLVPALPHQIMMTRPQLPRYMMVEAENERNKLLHQALLSEQRSYGVILNSFLELERAYSGHYTKVLGRKAWQIGPVSLCNKNDEDKASRGNSAASIDSKEYCLRWLDSKKPNSVLYICFGSMFKCSAAQLNEIANGVEASGQDFIWVLNKKEPQRLLEEYGERMKGKGLIIKGWAPQILILDHEAVGGFMTHCGWNSTIESISAGVPMVTWPLYAEQFCNERLVLDVLKVGVSVGAKECNRWVDDTQFSVSREDIERAVTKLMVGKEAEEMRRRARKLKDLAREAVEEGGSSHSDLNALLEELRLMNCPSK